MHVLRDGVLWGGATGAQDQLDFPDQYYEFKTSNSKTRAFYSFRLECTTVGVFVGRHILTVTKVYSKVFF